LRSINFDFEPYEHSRSISKTCAHPPLPSPLLLLRTQADSVVFRNPALLISCHVHRAVRRKVTKDALEQHMSIHMKCSLAAGLARAELPIFSVLGTRADLACSKSQYLHSDCSRRRHCRMSCLLHATNAVHHIRQMRDVERLAAVQALRSDRSRSLRYHETHGICERHCGCPSWRVGPMLVRMTCGLDENRSWVTPVGLGVREASDDDNALNCHAEKAIHSIRDVLLAMTSHPEPLSTQGGSLK